MTDTPSQLEGLNAIDRSRIDIRGTLICGKNVSVDTNIIFKGHVILEDNVSIGPNCLIIDAVIKHGAVIKEFTSIESSTVGPNCIVGPYARLRPGSQLDEGCHIGNYVEIKESSMGKACKVNHHSFVGNCSLGNSVILGAGFISCNHDGKSVQKIDIADNAYVGSGVQLVAPVHIGKNAFVGAGSTITEDVPENSLALSRSRQIIKKNWHRKQ